MQARQDHKITNKNRRTPLIPIKFLRAKLLREIALPAHLAVHFKRCEVAALEVDVNALAIGDRRGVAARAKFFVFRLRFRAEFGFPDLLAAQIQGDYDVRAVVGRGNENPVFPNDGAGRALPWKLDFPRDVIRAPLRWVAFASAAAVVRGAAPGSPVLGEQIRKAEQEQACDEK